MGNQELAYQWIFRIRAPDRRVGDGRLVNFDCSLARGKGVRVRDLVFGGSNVRGRSRAMAEWRFR